MRGGCSASAGIDRCVPQLRRLTGEKRGQLALEALWTAHLISGIDPTGRSSCWTIPTRRFDPGPLGCCMPRHTTGRPLYERLVRLARTEPDAEVRSELANTAARLEPELRSRSCRS